eukprot:2090264-Prymnesium_polylepis.1
MAHRRPQPRMSALEAIDTNTIRTGHDVSTTDSVRWSVTLAPPRARKKSSRFALEDAVEGDKHVLDDASSGPAWCHAATVVVPCAQERDAMLACEPLPSAPDEVAASHLADTEGAKDAGSAPVGATDEGGAAASDAAANKPVEAAETSHDDPHAAPAAGKGRPEEPPPPQRAA